MLILIKINLLFRLVNQLIKKEQNYRDLVDTFHKLGYNYDIALTYEPNKMKKDDKVKILSQILGCKVTLFKR